MLRKTISYHDYREDFYHAFLAGIFTGAGYHVESNREHGEGRSDVVVYDEMEMGCEKALEQINERMYTSEYEEEYDKIQCYGICFFKKRCLIKKKN